MNFFTNIFIILIISILFLQFVENAAKKKYKSLTTTTRSSKKNTSSKERKTTRRKKANKRKKSHKRRPFKNKNKKFDFLNVAMPRSRLPFGLTVQLADRIHNITKRRHLDPSDKQRMYNFGRKK